MSQVIRIPESIYRRLESHAIGFDTPAAVLERILDFYETHHHKTIKSRDSIESSTPESSIFESKQTSFRRKTYSPIASGRFSRDLENKIYTITSPDGVSKTFELPDVSDKQAIKNLTQNVEEFVGEQGGTIGQIKAARKKLTEFGYHITK